LSRMMNDESCVLSFSLIRGIIGCRLNSAFVIRDVHVTNDE
jgi:hypothetical protein